MSSKLAPLTAVIVMCCQQPIMAMQLPDGRVAATILSFCKVLNLNYSGQLQRIRRNEFLAKHLLLVPVRTKGGVQEMDVLIAEALPRWLSALQISRLSPEKQQLARALQLQAEQALHQHFSKKETGSTTQQEAAPEKTQPLYRSALEMHIEAWQETAQELDAREERYETRLAVVEQQLARVMAQVAALEQRDGGARGEEPPPQSGRILSPAHLGQVYVLARHQRDQTGEPISDMLRDLAETFDVPDMSDIPDEGWDHVLRWFRGRAQR